MRIFPGCPSKGAFEVKPFKTLTFYRRDTRLTQIDRQCVFVQGNDVIPGNLSNSGNRPVVRWRNDGVVGETRTLLNYTQIHYERLFSKIGRYILGVG